MSNTKDPNNFVLIKQIGKGSFSQVYLCKRNIQNAFAPTDLFAQSTESIRSDEEVSFIIKEINLNTLVKRYSSKHTGVAKHTGGDRHTGADSHTDDGFHNITPYRKGNDVLVQKNREYDYYYERLQGLIESEIQILKDIDHPNIIGFYQYTINDNVYKLHMEYCNRGDIYQILKSGVAPNGTRNAMGGIGGPFLTKFIRQISYGLHYLHEQNIIHRDIKLHNILLKSWSVSGGNSSGGASEHLQFKISDFGFACYNLKANPSFYSDVLGRKYYKLCGSPYYMAPEIVRNMGLLEDFTRYTKANYDPEGELELPLFYDTKYDIYSFGMCLYELIFNHLPLPKIKDIGDLEKFYRGTSCQQLIDQRIFKNKHIHTLLQEFLAKLLRVDAVFRSSASEVVDFIEDNGDTLRIACEGAGLSPEILDNSYLSQADLKQHIVNRPIDAGDAAGAGGAGGDRGQHSSWHYINNSVSLIRNIGAERGFLDWLLHHTKK